MAFFNIQTLLEAAEYIERREREAEHGYASTLPCDVEFNRKKGKTKKAQNNRSSHNELEKHRRAKLRLYLEQLKELVPLGPDSSRHTTLSLLKRARTHIKRRTWTLKGWSLCRAIWTAWAVAATWTIATASAAAPATVATLTPAPSSPASHSGRWGHAGRSGARTTSSSPSFLLSVSHILHHHLLPEQTLSWTGQDSPGPDQSPLIDSGSQSCLHPFRSGVNRTGSWCLWSGSRHPFQTYT
ncbi:max dimerization protein 4 isoform X1 [Amblyraja radiata]|uniref:max dimerization protein 4 isoform X1 n=1 Tax=Amblyraja radiata TaxID=386614 RepID=UPI00140330DF|nr:max dimerization protein 4 isoform X1 [Amblyraja radiata]